MDLDLGMPTKLQTRWIEAQNHLLDKKKVNLIVALMD
jgi:hypothetical protein